MQFFRALALVVLILQGSGVWAAGSPAASSAASSAASPAASTKTYLLVTDVDDTIKVSHIVDLVSKVVRFLSDPVSFAGMSTLYGSMIDEANGRGQKTGFVVLSGTPQLFESALWDFLEVFKFPEPLRVIARPMLLNTEDYKTRAVTKILGAADLADATVILIGDDTESDFNAYQNSLNATAAGAARAGRQTQIYIRRVTGKASLLVKTVSNAVAFDSAADIAMSEFSMGRLSRVAVERVFDEIEQEKDFQRLFVPDEYCPSARDPRLSSSLQGAPGDLHQRFVRLESRLRQRCRSLNAWIAGLLE